MNIQDAINLVIAIAAIIGIFLNVVSNLQLKKQRELQYLPFIRLSSFDRNTSFSQVDTILKVENIGQGIVNNLIIYSRCSNTENEEFEGVASSYVPSEVINSGEYIEWIVILGEVVRVSLYSNHLILYEDIFRNQFYVKCYYNISEEGLDFMGSSNPVKLKYMKKYLFMRRLRNVK